MSEPLDDLKMKGYEQAKKDLSWLIFVGFMFGMLIGLVGSILLGQHDLLTCTANLKRYGEQVAKFCWCAVKFV